MDGGMRYAIIAAGEGSRLAEEGISVPKPLVKVGDECLVDRLVKVFMAQGASDIFVICRDTMQQVVDHLEQLRQNGMPVTYVTGHTPSSMHSLYELSVLMGCDKPFCLTTVDTVFRGDEFAAYVAELQRLLDSGEADGLMGVTDYIDDEKPLYVSADERYTITAFRDSDPLPHYVSAGIYGLSPRAFSTLHRCVERGESRMRNFQRALLADGLRLRAWPFSTVIDIDHASDIAKASLIVGHQEVQPSASKN